MELYSYALDLLAECKFKKNAQLHEAQLQKNMNNKPALTVKSDSEIKEPAPLTGYRQFLKKHGMAIGTVVIGAAIYAGYEYLNADTKPGFDKMNP